MNTQAYNVFKWVKSINCSSKESKRLGHKTRVALGLTPKQYRKLLAWGRERSKVLEVLMSSNRFNEIEFDKIPSQAGLKYRQAFIRHDVERPVEKSYAVFAKSDAAVNAKDLAPYEVVRKALDFINSHLVFTRSYWNRDFEAPLDDTDRLMINKYWDNLKDYFNGASLNALCVCDTSGSMTCNNGGIRPIDVAISLSLYCAERAAGPFSGHYVSFASRPQLIETSGVDFVDKVYRIYKTNLVDNTNIEATFDLLLDTAITNNCSQDDLIENIIIISDMEFDMARREGWDAPKVSQETLMEGIEKKWAAHGYKMPNLIFWNVNGRPGNIPMTNKNGITFVSGASPVIFEMIMSGKTAEDLMYSKLDSDRYSEITI